MITKRGLVLMADILKGTVEFGKVGVGSGSTAATLDDTALASELLKKTATVSFASNEITVQATFNAGEATGTWQESGVFTSDNILFARATMTPVVKGAGDTKTCSWKWTVTEQT